MDNQQERQILDIGYLLGMIDGEGCYQLEQDGRGHFYPSFTLGNTDERIILKSKGILENLGVGCWIWTPKFHGKQQRPMLRLYVKGIKRMKHFLDIFTQYNHAKLDRANILKEYCELRLSIPMQELYSNTPKDYSRELKLKETLKKLNRKYKGFVSSETIRFGASST